jgi:hypothetical protein
MCKQSLKGSGWQIARKTAGGGQTFITILIVDSDLGFVFWLGHALDAAGYFSLPAKSIPDASELLRLLNREVDLLVLNCSLFGAADLIGSLRRSQPHLKVLAAGDPGEPVSDVHGVDLTENKPAAPDETSARRWLQSIRRLLGSETPTQNAGGFGIRS